jgi:N utilization substance protein A
VFSRERDVDPVGACVGMKGTRVQSIIRELRGEKIDIVEFSEDPIVFVTNALSPAKAQRVSIVDEHEHVMEVVVEDRQLSLAIGKKGQNVRLAAKLTGWRIDIKSEEEQRRAAEAQFEDLETAAEEPGAEAAETPEGSDAAQPAAYALTGIGDKTVRKLIEAGYGTVEALAAATAEQLQEVPGIGGKTAEKILAAARGDGETAPVDATVDTEERS